MPVWQNSFLERQAPVLYSARHFGGAVLREEMLPPPAVRSDPAKRHIGHWPEVAQSYSSPGC